MTFRIWPLSRNQSSHKPVKHRNNSGIRHQSRFLPELLEDRVVPTGILSPGTVDAIGGVEGTTPANLSIPFADTDTSDTSSNFSGTIQWGDGNTTPFNSSAVSGGTGNFTVSSTHQYANDGTYSITATVQGTNPTSFGSSLNQRFSTDGATGQMYIYNGAALPVGVNISNYLFRFHANQGGYVTPVLFHQNSSGRFVVKAVGQGHSISSAGVQSVPFNVQYGNAVTGTNYTIGFINALVNGSGSQTASSTGVIGWNNVEGGNGSTNSWLFTPTVGGLTVGVNDSYGSGGQFVLHGSERTYSANLNLSSLVVSTNTTVSAANTVMLQSLFVTPANPSVAQGQTQQLTATGTYSDSSTRNLSSQVTWSSSNTGVATVSNTGRVTAVSSGTMTVTATFQGKAATAGVTVSDQQLVDRSGNAGGIVTARGDNPPNETAAMAFDNNPSTKWLDFSDTSWIQYQFPNNQAHVITRYAITSANDTAQFPNRAPFSWQFQGSHDGFTWTTLDTRSNESDVENFHTRNYDFANATAYRYYRLANIVSSAALYPGSGIIQVADVRLFGPAGSTSPASLQSLRVTRASINIVIGQSQQLTATGTYSDGSTQDLSSQVTWSSSNTGKATVSNTGLVTAVSSGIVSISASVQGVDGYTSLIVTESDNQLTVADFFIAGVVALKSSDGFYVVAENAGNGPLKANRTTAGDWGQFEVIPVSGNQVALKAVVNGKYVAAEGGGGSHLIANRTAIGPWETFSVEAAGGRIALKAYNGTYVTAGDADVGASATYPVGPALLSFEPPSASNAPNLPAVVKAFLDTKIAFLKSSDDEFLATQQFHRRVIAAKTAIGADQRFLVYPLSGNQVALKSQSKGDFLNYHNGTIGNYSSGLSDLAGLGDSAKFTVEPVDATGIALKTTVGTYVTAEGGVVEASATSITSKARFTFGSVFPTGDPNPPASVKEFLNAGSVLLNNIAHEGYLSVTGNYLSIKDGAFENSQFEVVPLSGNQVALKTIDGRYVTVLFGNDEYRLSLSMDFDITETFFVEAVGDTGIRLKAYNDQFVQFDRFSADSPIRTGISDSTWQFLSLSNPVPETTYGVRPSLESDGTLSIEGTNQSDYVRVVQFNGFVTVAGKNSFPQEQVQRIRVRTYDGNDTIDLLGVHLPSIVLSGADDDLLIGGSGDDLMYGFEGNDTLLGMSGNDQLWGGNGDDRLDGGSGADTIYGEADNDNINGGGGNYADYLNGGAGNDTLTTTSPLVWRNTMLGGDGDDELYGYGLLKGENGADLLVGREGNDTLEGGDGPDTLKGGSGHDSLSGGMDEDSLFGEQGRDILNGDSGADLLHGQQGDDELYGGDGPDEIYGGEGKDQLYGGHGADYLHDDDLFFASFMSGDLGPDTLVGGNGKDTLFGADGADEIHGGLGDDVIIGGRDPDLLYGDNNDDLILGGDGSDSLFGGPGFDQLEGGTGADHLEGQGHDDTLIGGDGPDRLYGGLGIDVLDGGGGDDYLSQDGRGSVQVEQVSSLLYIDGTDGPDRITIRRADSSDLFYVEVGDGIVIGEFSTEEIREISVKGFDGDDVVTFQGTFQNDVVIIEGGQGDDSITGTHGIDRIFGGEGNDSILGGDGNDELHGGGGDDVIYGGGGRDRIIGYDGNDDLRGDDGDDDLDGGTGTNTLHGGTGNDRLFIPSGHDSRGNLLYGEAGDDHLEMRGAESELHGGEDNDTLVSWGGTNKLHGGPGNDRLDAGGNYNSAYGGEGADTLSGSDGNDNSLYGEGGDDEINGRGGNDSIFGGSGNDVLDGGDGFDHLEGNDGDDTLRGGNHVDHLFGGLGADVLYGGSSVDFLYGGEGNDRLYGRDGRKSYVNQPKAYLISGRVGRLERDSMNGGAGDDYLEGEDGNDTLAGGTGNDTLNGGVGDDIIMGESGKDTLYAGDGDDTLDGGPGTDVLYGGLLGKDFAHNTDGLDNLNGIAGIKVDGTEGDDFIRIEWTTAEDLDEDVVLGPPFPDHPDFVIIDINGVRTWTEYTPGKNGENPTILVYGHAGDDTIRMSNDGAGQHWDAEFHGGPGNDTLIAADELFFKKRSSYLYGDEGDDTLIAGAGKALLVGGEGADTLHGGSGATWILTDANSATSYEYVRRWGRYIRRWGRTSADRVIEGSGYSVWLPHTIDLGFAVQDFETGLQSVVRGLEHNGRTPVRSPVVRIELTFDIPVTGLDASDFLAHVTPEPSGLDPRIRVIGKGTSYHIFLIARPHSHGIHNAHTEWLHLVLLDNDTNFDTQAHQDLLDHHHDHDDNGHGDDRDDHSGEVYPETEIAAHVEVPLNYTRRFSRISRRGQ